MADRTSIPQASAGRKGGRATGYPKPSATMPARRQGAPKEGQRRLSPEERQGIIAETAYFIAERRGFSAGSELDDWLQAEAEVERRFGGAG